MCKHHICFAAEAYSPGHIPFHRPATRLAMKVILINLYRRYEGYLYRLSEDKGESNPKAFSIVLFKGELKAVFKGKLKAILRDYMKDICIA